ncbi:MAG: hypothetical protein RBS07_07810 [Lentimicrobium sp.]|jgi:hypothetical protein|nr:hypothetical protein [Lentimicrobium sp.]
MAREEEELLSGLRNLTISDNKIFVGEVTSVDYDKDFVDVDVDGLELGAARLRGIIDSEGNKVVAYPSVGSTVLLGRIGTSNELYVQAVGEVDKVLVRIGKMRLEATDQGFVFNEGKHTTANADILKSELNKLSKRLDDVISALNSASPDSASGSFKGTLVPLLQQITNKESFNQIDDDKIKH